MRSRRSLFVVSVLAASALITGGIASPAFAADPPPDFTATPVEPAGPPQDGARSKSGQLAESNAELIARADGQVVPIMVKVDVDPVASYTGDVDGYAATSPEITGKPLSVSDPAVAKYLKYVKDALAAAAADIKAKVPSATLLSSYPVAYGGLAMTVKARDAKAVLSVPGVAAVQENTLQHLPASESGATSADGSIGRRGPGRSVGARRGARQRRQHLHRSGQGLARAGWSRQGRQGRHHRRDRHRHLARAPDARRQRHPAPGRRPLGLRVRNGR